MDSSHPIDAWLSTNKKTRAWIAEQLDTTEATISRVAAGTQWPGPGFWDSLAKLTKNRVTANDCIPFVVKVRAAAT